MIRFLFLCILVTFPADASPPDIKPPLNTPPSLHLFPLRGELLHIYEGHISVRAVLVEHVTMKYRYAARYTEFVKQRKERILSALLVPRSSLRGGTASRTASGDSHSTRGLQSRAEPHSAPSLLRLHLSAHYQPAMFTCQLFAATHFRRGGCS